MNNKLSNLHLKSGSKWILKKKLHSFLPFQKRCEKYMKILCIDDDQQTVNVLGKMLGNRGHEFSFTRDGKDGLRLIRENNADVILLDIGIPYFNGLQIIDDLVKDGTIHNYNIIVLTAVAMDNYEFGKLIKKGVKKCIRKPCQLADILSGIES